MKKCLIFLLVLCLVGCTPADENMQEPVEGSARLIITVEDTGLLLLDTTVSLQSGDTALSVMQRATENKSDLSVIWEGSGKNCYVTAIGDYAAGVNGSMSGWIFLLNDEMAFTAAGDTAVSPGDIVTWKYITDFSN